MPAIARASPATSRATYGLNFHYHQAARPESPERYAPELRYALLEGVSWVEVAARLDEPWFDDLRIALRETTGNADMDLLPILGHALVRSVQLDFQAANLLSLEGWGAGSYWADFEARSRVKSAMETAYLHWLELPRVPKAVAGHLVLVVVNTLIAHAVSAHLAETSMIVEIQIEDGQILRSEDISGVVRESEEGVLLKEAHESAEGLSQQPHECSLELRVRGPVPDTRPDATVKTHIDQASDNERITQLQPR